MTNTITITVEARQLGGFNPDTSFYPVCQTAHLFASIAGTATLTDRVLKQLVAAGDVPGATVEYRLKIQHPPTIFGEAK